VLTTCPRLQDTISLYEERLNAAEALRLDMEIHIRSLQDQLEHLASSSSSTAPSSTFDPSSSSSMSSSSRTTADDRPSAAIQIDNENLTDQVRHLTGKITSLEEMLEDFQVQAEKDETAAKGRLERSKEQEEKLKRDIREARGQTDEVVKLENGARIRIGELEEALKEGAIALENARAELEETRAELAVCFTFSLILMKRALISRMLVFSLQQLEDQANGTVTDENDRLLESAKRSEAEKARLTEEILQLKQLLEDSRASKREALETAEDAKRELEEKDREIEDLKADWKTALMENDDVSHILR
jgi:CAP-Gly domain-containing linker protein 1